jgi:hypothetical protein
MCNRLRDRRRRVDNDQLEADALEVIETSIQLFQRRLRESGRGGRPRVPPFGQRPLGIGVDQRDGSIARTLRLDRDVTRQGRLSRPALLGREHHNSNAVSHNPLPACHRQP